MVEEQQNKKEEPIPSKTKNTFDVNRNKLIEDTNKAAERLEKANAQLANLMTRQEKLEVVRSFGGTAEAGTQEPTKEEKEKESAKSLLKGTGFEDVIC